MKTKRRLIVAGLMILCGALLTSSTARAEGYVTREDVITAVKNAENAIQDLKIEYTCIRRPCGSKGRKLTKDEQAKVDKYPGWYKQETGVLQQNGSKLRLDWTYYRSSVTKPRQQSIAYDGSKTLRSESRPDSSVQGVLSAGRSHNFRRWFNPVLTLSATGDNKLSDELGSKDADLAVEDHDVKGAACRLIKLYKENRKGNIVRSFNVYLDPDKNYAIRKVEKYWDEFLCLEQTVEVEEFTKAGGVYVPSKAVCVTYNRPRGSLTSEPVYEQELNVTGITLNKGIEVSVFELKFKAGARVWNSILEIGYTVKE